MSIKSKVTILSRKNYFQDAVEKRQQELRDLGMLREEILKNSDLRHLKAKVRECNRRLRVLTGFEKKNEELALHKDRKAQQEAEREKAPKKSKHHSEGKSKKMKNLPQEPSNE